MTAVRTRSFAATALAVAALAGLAACGRGGSSSPTSSGTGTPISGIPAPSASNLQQQFVQVVRAVSPKVVQIESQNALGSGVVFDSEGDVVTNAHVVAGARRLTVTLAGGERHTATLVGADRTHDLAVVRLDGRHPAPATFGDSSALEIGDLVLAIGNPLGLRSSVTQGIVSSLGRTVSEGNGVTLSTVIQTSAAINPGNSGGALVDLSGRVIGIPTLTALDPEMGNAQASGIGFAIPSETVTQVAGRLIEAN